MVYGAGDRRRHPQTDILLYEPADILLYEPGAVWHDPHLSTRPSAGTRHQKGVDWRSSLGHELGRLKVLNFLGEKLPRWPSIGTDGKPPHEAGLPGKSMRQV
jgi:hypothetical protein